MCVEYHLNELNQKTNKQRNMYLGFRENDLRVVILRSNVSPKSHINKVGRNVKKQLWMIRLLTKCPVRHACAHTLRKAGI